MIPVKEITLTRREGRASLCDHPYVARATARRTRMCGVTWCTR